MQSAGSIAAIIVEPIQGTAGNVLPPPGWLQEVRKIADELGALLILDEMITGWGRTGKLWGQEHFAVHADIMTFGKGVGSGFPVTGLVSSDDIVRAEPWSKPSFSSSSYGGGPLAAAAANAVTRVIVEERLYENAAQVGEALLDVLTPFAERFPFVGQVRGKGLLIGIDLVTDKKSRTPLPKADCEWIFTECLRRGLLTMAYAPRLRINPPLVITREQALEKTAILEEVFTAFAKRTTEPIS
jgi:4-aminobutyrate aminotransferase-like enzyme